MKKKVFFFILVLGLLTTMALAAKKPLDPRGRPAFSPLKPANFLVWQDEVGWHVRCVTKGKSFVFSGDIKSKSGVIENFKAIYPQLDNLHVKTSEKQIRFQIEKSKGVNGFDFETTAKKLKFNLRINGKGCSECIFIGIHSKNPKHSYFTLEPVKFGRQSPDDK